MIEALQNKWHFILASTSPRRRELLASMGFTFESKAPKFDEVPHPSETATDYCLRNALGKAQAVLEEYKDQLPNSSLILASDTIVVLDDLIIEKPTDKKDAARILGQLSGRTHQVFTACAFLEWNGSNIVQSHTFLDCSQVTFRILHSEEINHYLKSDEAMDKAGAYGIQGKSAYFIENISGSYTGVMGLPLGAVYEKLVQLSKLSYQD